MCDNIMLSIVSMYLKLHTNLYMHIYVYFLNFFDVTFPNSRKNQKIVFETLTKVKKVEKFNLIFNFYFLHFVVASDDLSSEIVRI